jgi:predicted dehydrogenase
MTLRVAVVGCGAVAEMGHIPAAMEVGKIRLVVLVDSDQVRAETLAKRFGVPRAVCNLREVVGEIDGAILATPPHVRPLLAEQAFSAGLHVLCEKPLANSSAECKAIIAAAEQSGRVLAVAHTARFFRNRMHICSLLQQKAIGTIHRVDLEQGDPYDWPTRTGYVVRREMVNGGVLLNEGIHSLDTLFWWFGYPENFDYQDDAIGGLESNVRIALRFAGGITGTFRLSRTCKLENRLTVEGELGLISLPLYNQARVFLRHAQKTNTYNLASFAWDFADLVTEQLNDFVESIENQRPPRVTGGDGARVIEFIERCYATKQTGPLPERVPLPGLTW